MFSTSFFLFLLSLFLANIFTASLANYAVTDTKIEPIPGYRLFVPIHTTSGLAPHLTSEIIRLVEESKLFCNIKMWDLQSQTADVLMVLLI